MKVFWNNCGRGPDSNAPKEVDRKEATEIWLGKVRGIHKNFFGLVDDAGRTIQFYFDESIPDDVEDASHLRIVYMDFPLPERKGSFGAQVTVGEVQAMIAKAFAVGADHMQFDNLKFNPW